jgi:hypothetical protein
VLLWEVTLDTTHHKARPTFLTTPPRSDFETVLFSVNGVSELVDNFPELSLVSTDEYLEKPYNPAKMLPDFSDYMKEKYWELDNSTPNVKTWSVSE